MQWLTLDPSAGSILHRTGCVEQLSAAHENHQQRKTICEKQSSPVLQCALPCIPSAGLRAPAYKLGVPYPNLLTLARSSFSCLKKRCITSLNALPLAAVAIDKLSMLTWALIEAVTANEVIE
jgi:hypothetical protein